jgi:prepilin peptidase CpaA
MTGNVILILYVLLAFAAAMDIWLLRISNGFPLAIVALFLAWLYLCGVDRNLWQNGVMFAVTLVGATMFFSRGWIGGGDAKLLAAIALWFDFKGGAALLFYVSLGGAMLSLVFVMLRRMQPASFAARHEIRALKPRGPIPYGVAIASGAALAILGGSIRPQPEAWHPLFPAIHVVPAPVGGG